MTGKEIMELKADDTIRIKGQNGVYMVAGPPYIENGFVVIVVHTAMHLTSEEFEMVEKVNKEPGSGIWDAWAKELKA